MIECIMNVSEGCRAERIQAIAREIEMTADVFLLDVSSDCDHHRTVYSFIGTRQSVGPGAFAAIRKAAELIDLNAHRGVHPRVGATDVVPFFPLQGVTRAECVGIARVLGEQVASRLDIPVYFYGDAALRPERVSLPQIRRGGFERLRREVRTDPAKAPDLGAPRLHPTAGAVVIGVREALIAFNIFLKSSDVEVARAIARRVRESSGGLPAVQALGFYIRRRDQVQVSLNLIDYHRTSLFDAFRAVQGEAARRGLEIDSSELIGLAPADALDGPLEMLRLENFGPGRVLERRIEEVKKGS